MGKHWHATRIQRVLFLLIKSAHYRIEKILATSCSRMCKKSISGFYVVYVKIQVLLKVAMRQIKMTWLNLNLELCNSQI